MIMSTLELNSHTVHNILLLFSLFAGLDTSGGLGHGSYVGGIVGVLCFLAIIVVYLIIK